MPEWRSTELVTLRQMVAGGYTNQEIAWRLQRSVGAVEQAKRRAGLCGPRARVVTERVLDSVVTGLASGKTLYTIAKQLDLPPSLLYSKVTRRRLAARQPSAQS